MKASKLKIVVILLLIIFFGLLILFWSRNIYEGLTNRPSPLLTKMVGDVSPTKWVVGTGVTDSNAPKPKGKYYIRVYYYIPDNYQFDDKGNKNFNSAGIPIIYLDHNLAPDLYNVYYSNSDAFSDESKQSNSVRIYIQSNSSDNNSVKQLTPSSVWKEVAVSAGKQEACNNKECNDTQLKVWASNGVNGENRQKWEKITTKIIPTQLTDKITDTPLIYSPSNNKSILTPSDVSAPKTTPSDYTLSNLLPIKYRKISEMNEIKNKNNTMVYWDARYGATTNAIIVNKDLDNNADLGALNLVTYYLTFP